MAKGYFTKRLVKAVWELTDGGGRHMGRHSNRSSPRSSGRLTDAIADTGRPGRLGRPHDPE